MYKRRYFYEVILKNGTTYYNDFDNYYNCDKLCNRVNAKCNTNDIYRVIIGFNLIK